MRQDYKVVTDDDPDAVDGIEEFIDRIAAGERRACIQELLKAGGILFCDAARLLRKNGATQSKVR